jgi:hypothetical protein
MIAQPFWRGPTVAIGALRRRRFVLPKTRLSCDRIRAEDPQIDDRTLAAALVGKIKLDSFQRSISGLFDQVTRCQKTWKAEKVDVGALR